MASANPIAKRLNNEETPAASLPAPSAAEGMSANTSTLNDLLAAYIVEARHLSILRDRYDAALARLPAWAVPGPRHLFSNGHKGGAVVGSPEVANLPTPDLERGSVFFLIRPSLREVWHRATLLMPSADNPRFAASRRKQRLAGFAAVRRVIARMREQRAERTKAGLPAIESAMDASYERWHEIERQILALSSSTTPADLAVMATFEFMASSGECVLALHLLRRLAPLLSGLVRVVVDDLVEKGEDILDDPAVLNRTMLRGACDAHPVDALARSEVEWIAA